MMEFMAEMRTWRITTKEENKSLEDGKVKEIEAKQFVNHGQGSGSSQVEEAHRLEDSLILMFS